VQQHRPDFCLDFNPQSKQYGKVSMGQAVNTTAPLWSGA
jgi:hypothetical protein